jgi:eukaryotic-like serine/threonine-protein kinase
MGRALDCFVRLSGAERDKLISRHHCQLDIDPPTLRVRDLGSTNGTFINGKKVELSPKESSEKVGAVIGHSDLLTIGGTTVQVETLDCPFTGIESERKSMWKAGLTAKENCRLYCCE